MVTIGRHQERNRPTACRGGRRCATSARRRRVGSRGGWRRQSKPHVDLPRSAKAHRPPESGHGPGTRIHRQRRGGGGVVELAYSLMNRCSRTAASSPAPSCRHRAQQARRQDVAGNSRWRRKLALTSRPCECSADARKACQRVAAEIGAAGSGRDRCWPPWSQSTPLRIAPDSGSGPSASRSG